MAYEDDIQALEKTGNGATAAKVATESADEALQTFASIREDQRITEEHRQRLLAQASLAARQKYESKIQAAAARVVRTDRTDAAQVFGTVGLAGDPASLTISMRDASDRVAKATESELPDLLERATRSGDEVLARAIAARAFEERNAAVANRFIDARPHLTTAAERLWKAQDNHGRLQTLLMVSQLRPPELQGMSRGQLENLVSA